MSGAARTTPVPASLDEALAELRRRHGAGVVRRGGGPVAASAWPTGVPTVDSVLPGGGLPWGRLAVLAGGGGGATGRLTLLQAFAAAASRSMQVAYVDLAGSLDPGYLADLGADLDACLVVRPPGGHAGRGLAMARALVAAGIPWLGVAMGRRPGPAAGLEHAVTALAAVVEGSRAVACVAAPAPLAAPLAYASSLTLECAGAGWQEAHGDVVGLRVRLRTAKSKLGAPGRDVSLLLRHPRPHAVGEVVGLPAVLTADPPGAAEPAAQPAAIQAAG